MRQIIGLILAVFVIIFIIYAAFFYEKEYVTKEAIKNNNIINDNSMFIIYFAGNGSDSKISMKQIDSLTAAMNLNFTIKNAVSRQPLDLLKENKIGGIIF